jgi:protein-disulfide isomerase
MENPRSDESLVEPPTEPGNLDRQGPSQRQRRVWDQRAIFDAVGTIVMTAAAVTLVWVALGSRGRAGSRVGAIPELILPKAALSIDDAPAQGSPTANVVLIQFSEFQCPYCGKFATETLPQLTRDYIAPGRVQLIFRHLPLRSHQFALRAGEAAECAGAQGAFWPMHDLLFRNQRALEEASLNGYARDLKLDATKFKACMRGEAMAKVSRDEDVAKGLGIASTPMFLVGIRKHDGKVQIRDSIRGARPYDDFRGVLDRILSKTN